MILNQHSRYKYLGVEGLEIIPSDWNYDRMKNIGIVNGRVGWKALKASEYVDKGYFFLATPNIKDREIDYLNVNYITYERYKESPEIMLRNNDILLTKDGSTLGTINIVKNLNTPGTVNSSIAVLRFKKQFNSRYFFYLISSNFIQSIIQVKKDGMGVPHLFQKDINNFLLLIPPDKEQDLISNFLDQKTAAIDKKIFLLQTKISYYKELSKSLINEAVCRGLNKNVPLKESGIEWIGHIPKHWQIKRLKDVASLEFSNVDKLTKEGQKEVLLCNYTDVYKNNFITRNIDFMLSTASGVEIKRFSLRKGDILITKDSETHDDIAIPSLVTDNLCNVICGYHLAMIRTKGKLTSSYLFYLYKSSLYNHIFARQAKGITRVGLSINSFGDALVFIPPVEEQTAIADYLDNKIKTIEAILKNITAQIEGLNELRKTLINDIVTGKLRVSEQ